MLESLYKEVTPFLLQEITNQMAKQGRTLFNQNHKAIIVKDEHHTIFKVRFSNTDEKGKKVWAAAANTPLHTVRSFPNSETYFNSEKEANILKVKFDKWLNKRILVYLSYFY